MANLKISELDAGTTPLVGDELVAVVQAGATVRVPSSALKGLQGDPGDDGREVELQKGATHIQWRYVGDPTWTDLVSLDDITGPPGPRARAARPSGMTSKASPTWCWRATVA